MDEIGRHDNQQEEAVKEEPVDLEKPDVPEAAVSVSGWETVRGDLPSTEETLSQITVDSSTLPTQDVDGEEVLLFYWLDACDLPYHQPGTVYLFGKVWAESAGTFVRYTYVSCEVGRGTV
jgi:DNA polymerase alpha subunit A